MIFRNAAGEIHCDSGPAIEWANGSKMWYQNDQLHRTDGPAIEWYDGYKEYWLRGKKITEAEFHLYKFANNL